MASCPKCRQPIAGTSETCPRCDAPSSGRGAGPAADLVLEGLDAAPAPAPPRADTPTAQVPDAVPVESVDTSWEIDPFERDMSHVHYSTDDAPAPASTTDGVLELAVPTRARAPEAQAPSPVQDVPTRASEVAGYGPSPHGLVQAARYALHVRRRRGEMARETDKLSLLLREARINEENALAVLAAAARDAGLTDVDPGLSAATTEAEASRAETSRRIAEVESQQRRRLAELAREHETATSEVPALQARETDLAATHAEKSEHLRRADSRVRRAEIEIRNRQRLVAERRAQAAASPADSARLLAEAERLEAEIETFGAEREARAAEAQRERETVTALEGQLSELRRRIAAALGRGSLVQERIRKEEESFRRQKAEHSRRADAVEAEARARLAEVGKRVLREHCEAGEIAEQRGTAGAAILARELLEREIDVLGVAMRTFDPEGVKTGWMVLGGAAALVVIAVVLVVALG